MAEETAVDRIKQQLKDLTPAEKGTIRDQINIELTGIAEGRQGSADVDADDEKKKYIAQFGDPNAQRRAQDVPEPESDELKRLQDQKSLEEHQAAGQPTDDNAKREELA